MTIRSPGSATRTVNVPCPQIKKQLMDGSIGQTGDTVHDAQGTILIIILLSKGEQYAFIPKSFAEPEPKDLWPIPAHVTERLRREKKGC